jgi:sigma-B regulation protein RsbU (phosphoserine phosphatase)
MSRLVVENGNDKGMIFPLVQPSISIGRSASNAIQIVDRRVSRQHAELRAEGGTYGVKDLGSKNGTYVNGKLIEGDRILGSGDRVQVGDTIMVFEHEIQRRRSREDTTKAVRLVAEKAWGETTGTRTAGTQTPEKVLLDTAEGEYLKETKHRLEILYQVTDAIRSILNLNLLLEKIMSIIFSVMQPDRGFIMLRDDATGELLPQVVKKRIPEEESISVSRTIVDQCIRDRVSMLVSDAARDRRFQGAESIIMHRICSAICSPLIYKNDVLGVIYIDTKSRIGAYGEAELDLLTGISNQSAVAIANAKLHAQVVEQQKLEKEMEIARSIQMNLLPRTYPLLPGYEMSAMSKPAERVGGDYYDFLPLPKGRCGLAMGDVSGKGVAAALLIATLRASLQIEAALPNVRVTQVMEKLNKIACRDATNNMFASMFYGILDPLQQSLEYVNAGHCHPLLFDETGQLRTLGVGGHLLGIIETAQYEKEIVTIMPGSTMIIYSDGLADTMNSAGDLYGLERLIEFVRSHLTLRAEMLRDAIYQNCLEFRAGAEQFDDFTLIVLKALRQELGSTPSKGT